VGHHHHVLVDHGLWVLDLVIVLADGPSVAVVWLVTSANLQACAGCNVRVAVCRVVQRVYRVNLVCTEVLLLGLLLRLDSELAATVCDVI